MSFTTGENKFFRLEFFLGKLLKRETLCFCGKGQKSTRFGGFAEKIGSCSIFA
jgi:hypothetical protein